MRTRVKICGITRTEDGLAAAEAGADSIGLVFYPKSPRNVSIEQAREICAALPPFVTVTALFLDPRRELVASVVDALPVDLLQFHGDECVADCTGFGRPYIKVIGMRANTRVKAYADCYADAAGILLDGHAHGAAGGSGETFDWRNIPGDLGKPVIIAGGLTPDNVAAAIRQARPWGVDLSSGVEISPGVKDHGKIAALMNEVRRVDCEG